MAKSGANLHMTHAEDAVLYGGVSGTREVIFALRAMRDMLSGNSNKRFNTTLKLDGAPAVFCGTDPDTGKFFVAKKSLFNATPKFYTTHAEVDADTSGDLAKKLRVALDVLAQLKIPKGTVLQGDIMYTSDDLRTETIDGEKYLIFHPNTIAYAVPAESDMAKKIKKSKLGVGFHTTYTGSSLTDMKASFGVDDSKLKPNSNLWLMSTNIDDLSGSVTMTAAEQKEINAALSEAGKIFNKIAGSTIKAVAADRKLAQTIEQFNNKFVRDGKNITNTSKHVDDLIKWIEEKFQKDIDKLKTEKGKNRKKTARDEFLEFFSSENKANLKLMFDLQKALVVCKLLIINKLSKLNSVSTFVQMKDGYKVTGQEGFVAIDHLSGKAVKLVDRLTFSHQNFSADVIKAWQRL